MVLNEEFPNSANRTSLFFLVFLAALIANANKSKSVNFGTLEFKLASPLEILWTEDLQKNKTKMCLEKSAFDSFSALVFWP